MERISRIWEIELQAVLEINKIGHRKRILYSVGATPPKSIEKFEKLTKSSNVSIKYYQINTIAPKSVRASKDFNKNKRFWYTPWSYSAELHVGVISQ